MIGAIWYRGPVVQALIIIHLLSRRGDEKDAIHIGSGAKLKYILDTY
jgi:hypothetical protein